MSVFAEEPVIRRIAAAGIENFSRLDGLQTFGGTLVGFGGATEPEALAWLKSEGFASVINLRAASEKGVDVDVSRHMAGESGLDYIHIPFNPAAGDLAVIEKFLAATGDTANQPVYIHCGSATRVAALWMIGRVLEDGLDPQQAVQEVRQISDEPDTAIAAASALMKHYRE